MVLCGQLSLVAYVLALVTVTNMSQRIKITFISSLNKVPKVLQETGTEPETTDSQME